MFHWARKEILLLSEGKRFFFPLQTGGRENGGVPFYSFGKTMASKESRGRFTDARGESVFFLTFELEFSLEDFLFFLSFVLSALVSFFPNVFARVLVLYTLFLEEDAFPRRTKTRANEFYLVYIYLRGIYLIYCIIDIDSMSDISRKTVFITKITLDSLNRGGYNFPTICILILQDCIGVCVNCSLRFDIEIFSFLVYLK